MALVTLIRVVDAEARIGYTEDVGHDSEYFVALDTASERVSAVDKSNINSSVVHTF